MLIWKKQGFLEIFSTRKGRQMERISEKQKKMKDKLTRALRMVEARLSFIPKIFSAIKEVDRKNFILEQQKKMKGTLTSALRMVEAKLSFFSKIYLAIKEADRRNFILEQQKKMKDTLTRELTMVETRLEREQDKQEEWKKTRFEQEQTKNAELEKISITALQKVNIN
jgi:hypothetical protein